MLHSRAARPDKLASGEVVLGGAHARATLSYWPIVINIVEDGYDLAEMELALEANERALRMGTPFVTIRDMRRLTQHANPLQRKRLAQWQDEMRDLIAANCLGAISISESAMVRGMIRAVFWMSTPPIPEEVVGTVDEALGVAFRWLDARGVERSPECSRERLRAVLEMQRV